MSKKCTQNVTADWKEITDEDIHIEKFPFKIKVKESPFKIKSKSNLPVKKESELPAKKGHPFVLEEADIRSALIQYGGFIAHVAKSLNVSTRTIYNYLERYPRLKEILEDVRVAWIDLAESRLMDNVLKGDPNSIFFLLKCQGSKRGWMEKKPSDKDIEDRRTAKIDTINLNFVSYDETKKKKIVNDRGIKIIDVTSKEVNKDE